MRAVLKARYGPKTRLKLITPPRGLFGRGLGFFGSQTRPAAAEFASAAADRADRCGRGARSVEPLRALKQPDIRGYHCHHLPRRCATFGKAAQEMQTMPQLIFFILVGLAAYVGYRSFVKEAERVTAKVRRAARSRRRTAASGTLVKDPKTGEYRLAKD